MSQTCPECKGSGEVVGFFPVYSEGCEGPREPVKLFPCFRCKGACEVPDDVPEWIAAGKEMKRDRLFRNVGLREESELRGMLPSVLCDMELGRVEPIPRTRRELAMLFVQPYIKTMFRTGYRAIDLDDARWILGGKRFALMMKDSVRNSGPIDTMVYWWSVVDYLSAGTRD